MPRKTHRTPPAAAPAEPKPEALKPIAQETVAAPDWVRETPDDTEYSLTMHDGSGFCPQDIGMTREEFIRLKRWLAALRGYPLDAPRDRFQYGCGNNSKELKQLALDITQEEIQMVQDADHVIDVLCLNIRRRLRLGAKVEPGKWRLDEIAADTIESYEEQCIVGGGSCGLSIEEATEEATATARA